MTRLSRQVWFGIMLIVLSVLAYYIHFLIFRDPHHIFIFMMSDVAFVFIEVLLVSLIIHQVLEQRERRIRLEKLNMVIGAFFSEIGTTLLTYFSNLDPNLDVIRQDLIVSSDWSDEEFDRLIKKLRSYSYQVRPDELDLVKIRCYVVEKRDFLLSMMENPNLMEHETFTELLRAVFHLAEEMKFREIIEDLPEEDIGHLTRDINRAYSMLVYEWVAYMKHLKENFPYFFSLAMRTNPFDQKASVVVGAGQGTQGPHAC
ncbi:MAG: hypothetical protein ACOX3E_00415 [Desulfomonilia bacterium]|uniref:Uncharacterized protein n=1 Tax=anaerobic digester metagenome TaxID=1263854 RepID=A0A485LTQ4_9ZZZZ|nr:hypothetical protein [Pseudomonadota bacterium]HON39429.1 hypothetical protein [Deltaproteobacteria bacterium]HRS57180.1 hypothetical protein [Desulfomonilia bacterium]HPD21263.1 hypothetical protein [Deltaproteobacteria bacterium]HPX18945.1 hypothetical protein [Deltaproteobacteria bacterium]